ESAGVHGGRRRRHAHRASEGRARPAARMTTVVDVAIVGAGPAGLGAAIAARRHGLNVVVLDEQAAPGGQIYRNVEAVAHERHARLAALGDDYAAGLEVIAAFRACGADYSP